MKKISISIGGMTCASCAGAIQKALQNNANIEQAIINIATERADITYNDKIITINDIKKIVTDTGYFVVEEQSNTDKAILNKREIRAQKKKAIYALIFAIPLLYIAMAPMITFIQLPFPEFLDPMNNGKVYSIVQILLCLPVILIGYKFYLVGFKSLFKLRPNMDSLIAVGTSAAFIYSIYSVYKVFNGDHMAIDYLYFETTSVIIAFVLLGKYLELKSKGRTGEAIKKLLNLSPKTATVIRDDEEMLVPIESVVVGDIIAVRPGESIPVDGIILTGVTTVDESMVTGESIPVDKTEGSNVIGATINKNGYIKFKATKVGKDTVISQIIKLIEDAQGSKAPISKFADVISLYFVPAIIILAILCGVFWYFVNNDFLFALEIFIAIMVIACPCALGLATPIAIMVGTGKGAECGILFKSGEALERAHKLDTVIFDKTGTITKGAPYVTDIVALEKYNPHEIIMYAASAEKGSEHPLGKAIVDYADSNKINIVEISDFNNIVGCGITATVNSDKIMFGNLKLMQQFNIMIDLSDNRVDKFAAQGKTSMYLAVNDILVGIVAVADIVKETSAEAILKLNQLGIETVMLTGDNSKTANAIANQVGITKIFADVMPDKKASKVRELQEMGKVVAMVGDGINDSPALVQADVGIAIGSGTDVAIESADIVLVKNDLLDVLGVISLSKATIRNIKQNLFWAFGYNILGIPFAAGLLYLFGGPLLNPMIAAAAMSLSSVSVVLNALRLNTFKLKK